MSSFGHPFCMPTSNVSFNAFRIAPETNVELCSGPVSIIRGRHFPLLVDSLLLLLLLNIRCRLPGIIKSSFIRRREKRNASESLFSSGSPKKLWKRFVSLVSLYQPSDMLSNLEVGIHSLTDCSYSSKCADQIDDISDVRLFFLITLSSGFSPQIFECSSQNV